MVEEIQWNVERAREHIDGIKKLAGDSDPVSEEITLLADEILDNLADMKKLLERADESL